MGVDDYTDHDGYLDHDDYVDDEDQDDEEWREGQCDNCSGSPPAQLAAAATGNALVTVCACSIGQGTLDPNECTCSPR